MSEQMMTHHITKFLACLPSAASWPPGPVTPCLVDQIIRLREGSPMTARLTTITVPRFGVPEWPWCRMTSGFQVKDCMNGQVRQHRLPGSETPTRRKKCRGTAPAETHHHSLVQWHLGGTHVAKLNGRLITPLWDESPGKLGRHINKPQFDHKWLVIYRHISGFINMNLPLTRE